jgi:ubiquitin carboxyl-terminal hydrolase 8
MNNQQKGLSGLQNLGNTCFLNSAMQCFSHTYELNQLLDNTDIITKINNKPEAILLKEWNELRKLLWSKNCIITPGGFVHNIQQVSIKLDNDNFAGWAQNDLPEFIYFMMNGFHTALEREVDILISGSALNSRDRLAKIAYTMIKDMYTKEYSEMIPIFFGIQFSTIRSLDGRIEKSIKAEPYFMLDLPIPDTPSPSLLDCIHLYIEDEIMCGENAWYNDKTKQKEDVIKSLQFWSLPSILIMDLKRFNKLNFRKNNCYVDIPLEPIDLSKYVIGYQKESYVYELYGICNHSGNVMGGHYTANVKTNSGWYHFNDSNVTKITDESKIISPMAYCLFFRKKK